MKTRSSLETRRLIGLSSSWFMIFLDLVMILLGVMDVDEDILSGYGAFFISLLFIYFLYFSLYLQWVKEEVERRRIEALIYDC